MSQIRPCIHVSTAVDISEYYAHVIISSGCELLGFDMEWKPNFGPGEENPIALIQLSTDTDTFLFHLPRMGFEIPPGLQKILEDPRIKKVGFGLTEDVKLLFKHSINPVSTYDLDILIKSLGWGPTSLQLLTARVLDLYIDKRRKITCSNWEKPLTREQIIYAATDAWVVLKLYRKLFPHFYNGDYRLFDQYCFICNHDLGYNTELFIHRLDHHYNTVFPCLLCNKVFATFVALQNHLLSHENGHICQICNFEFPDIISCVYHKLQFNHNDLPNNLVKSKLSSKRIPCSKCKRVFRTQSALNDHYNSKHTGLSQPYVPNSENSCYYVTNAE